MTRRLASGTRLSALEVAAGVAMTVAACQANDDAFYEQVFPCSTSAQGDPCGTTRSGKPMVCYPGSQLGGGTDFCTERCDPDAGVSDEGSICLASGAELKKCMPDVDGGTNGCPPGLSCYRTDLVNDEGVCLMMHVCSTDGDCTDSQRPKCTATIINSLFPGLTTDNLYCTQNTCVSSGSSCLSNEVCLASYYDTGKSVEDICVPRCVGDGECPPNFACAKDPYAIGAPSICLPGVPGERCQHDEDCLLGKCQDTGAGFNECLFWPCSTDADCVPFDVQQNFVCANKICVGLTPFNGTACANDGDCPLDQKCFTYSPYNTGENRGECRQPCDVDPCQPRAGVPQVCLDDGAGGCYPGGFALPCTSSDQCLSFFQCLSVSPDPRTIITSPSICTSSCATDDDCWSNPAIHPNGGFCEDGACRMPGQAGAPCDRGAQCFVGFCNASGQCQ
jgi:hypothetical protein